MLLHEEGYGTLIPTMRVRNLQTEWDYMIALNIGEERYCTLKYYAWQNVVSHMVPPSAVGLRGFTNIGFVEWVRTEVLPRVELTTPMYNQIVSSYADSLPLPPYHSISSNTF